MFLNGQIYSPYGLGLSATRIHHHVRRCICCAHAVEPITNNPRLVLSFPFAIYISLTMEERRRSRSPDRQRPKKSGGGFRWKEKRRDDDSGTRGDERRLERGYRDRGDRSRSPRRERDADRYGDQGQERTQRDEKEERRERKREKREKKAVAAMQSSEPMIVVNVNDRLGTKAAIPCLASDPISLFPLPSCP